VLRLVFDGMIVSFEGMLTVPGGMIISIMPRCRNCLMLVTYQQSLFLCVDFLEMEIVVQFHTSIRTQKVFFM